MVADAKIKDDMKMPRPLHNGEDNFRAKVLKGFTWFTTGTFAGQAISWISTLIIIRLLSPSDYGLMAMTLPFITFMSLISELGVSATIIQAQELNEKEISQIYGLAILMNAAIGGLSYISAPTVALFYHEQKLIPLLQALSASFLFSSLYSVPHALTMREMDYRTKAKVDVLSRIITAMIMLVLVLKGAGVWALVAGEILQSLIRAIGYPLARKSWLTPNFRLKGMGHLMKYGLTFTGDKLLYLIFIQSDKVIIGKFLGKEALGLYAIAQNLAFLPMEKTLPIIAHFSFTAYSRIQDDLARIQRNLRRTVRNAALLSFPVFLGMAGIAPEAVPLILGAKWQWIIVPLQMLSLVLPLFSISILPPPAVYAIGRPAVNLTNMVILSTVMPFSFFIGVHFGLMGVCTAWITVFPFVLLINTTRCLSALKMDLKQFLNEIQFPLFISILMLFSMFLLRKPLLLFVQPLSLFGIFIFFGFTFYCGLLFLFKKDELFKLKALLHR